MKSLLGIHQCLLRSYSKTVIPFRYIISRYSSNGSHFFMDIPSASRILVCSTNRYISLTSSLTKDNISKFGHSSKKRLEKRKVMIPDDHMKVVVSGKFFYKYGHKYNKNSVAITEVDRDIYENPPHFLVIAPSTDIDKIEVDIKKDIQEILDTVKIQKVFIPGDESEFFIHRIIAGLELLEFKRKFGVFAKIMGRNPSYILICEENLKDLTKAAEYMQELVDEIHRELHIRTLNVTDDNMTVKRAVLLHLKKIEEKFGVLADMRGQGTVNPSDEPGRVLVAGRTSSDAQEAVQSMDTFLWETRRTVYPPAKLDDMYKKFKP